MTTDFDKKAIFEKECKPLLTQLETICSFNKIPFFWAACTKNSDEGSDYEYAWSDPTSHMVELKNDLINKFFVVAACGFDVRPHRDTDDIVIDMADMDADEQMFD